MKTIQLNFEDFKGNQLNKMQASTIKGGKQSSVPGDPPIANPIPTPPAPLPGNGYPADPEVPQQPNPNDPFNPSPYIGQLP